mmetsp:Transcript_29193/g.28254  ORF Transcript_29193/g.28254 Transcript_29193/m.28254 type:complete len:96 (-) Transcript_29193:852-1139(-)
MVASRYKLNIQQYGKKSDNQIFLEERDLPDELIDMKKCINHYVTDNFVYLLFQDCFQQWNLKTDEIFTGQINREYLMEMMIFDNEYYYWRSQEKR